jgi:hypothetical protein
MKTLKFLAVLVTIMPVLAFATTGQYKVTFQSENQGGYISTQDICIVKDGTWYGTSFPNWSGKWFKNGNDVHLHGNYAFGYGNDAFELTKILPNLLTGYWQEWTDDGSYDNYLTVKFEKTSNYCAQPFTARSVSKVNPSSK